MIYVLFILLIVVLAALIFEYTNGFQDAANAIATVVSTKVLSPRQAILYGACLNFLGAFFGTAVAKTVGSGLVDTSAVTQEVILCGLIGAIALNVLTWFYGIPISCSHSLIGGLLGAAIAHNGFRVVIWDGLFGKVIVPMFMSPLIGFVAGFIFMLILLWMFAKASPERINKKFKGLQVFSAGIMAFSHGSNDAQKTMGIITLTLLTFTFFCLEQNLGKKTTVYYDSARQSATVLPFGTLNKTGYVSDGYIRAKVLHYDKETGSGTIQPVDKKGNLTGEVLNDVKITRSFAIPFWVIFLTLLCYFKFFGSA